MFAHTRNFARRFGGHLILFHLLLAAFNPLLHAHSIEPDLHQNGFHAHFDLPQQDIDICATCDELPSPLTVEVGDLRHARASEFAAHDVAIDSFEYGDGAVQVCVTGYADFTTLEHRSLMLFGVSVLMPLQNQPQRCTAHPQAP